MAAICPCYIPFGFGLARAKTSGRCDFARCATGRLAAGQMPLAGSKVCDNCGTQEASCWYGKAGGPHWCKKAACMRAGGYLPPLQARGGKRARSGGEGSDGAGPNEEDMLAAEPIPHVWELLAVEGQRFCGRVAELWARRGPCTRSPARAPCRAGTATRAR